MATGQLKNTELEFKNSEGNTGKVSFTTDEEFEANRAFKFSAGIVSSSISVGEGGGFTTSTKFNEITLNDVKVTAPTSGVTAYTMTLPNAQGSASAVLTNDGSGGLSWSTPPAGSWTQFGSTVSSGFTNTNTKCDIDITNFKNGSDEEMFVVVGTSVHALTFVMYKSLLSVMDHGNNGGYKHEVGAYGTRYMVYKIYDSQTNLELELGGGLTFNNVKMYTR